MIIPMILGVYPKKWLYLENKKFIQAFLYKISTIVTHMEKM